MHSGPSPTPLTMTRRSLFRYLGPGKSRMLGPCEGPSLMVPPPLGDSTVLPGPFGPVEVMPGVGDGPTTMPPTTPSSALSSSAFVAGDLSEALSFLSGSSLAGATQQQR